MNKELLWKAYWSGFQRSTKSLNGSHISSSDAAGAGRYGHHIRYDSGGFEDWYAENVEKVSRDE